MAKISKNSALYYYTKAQYYLNKGEMLNWIALLFAMLNLFTPKPYNWFMFSIWAILEIFVFLFYFKAKSYEKKGKLFHNIDESIQTINYIKKGFKDNE